MGVSNYSLDFTQHCLNVTIGHLLANVNLVLVELALKLLDASLRLKNYFIQSSLGKILNDFNDNTVKLEANIKAQVYILNNQLMSFENNNSDSNMLYCRLNDL